MTTTHDNGQNPHVRDPYGLTRCATCTNAFLYDRDENGVCRHCGGDYDGGRNLLRFEDSGC